MSCRLCGGAAHRENQRPVLRGTQDVTSGAAEIESTLHPVVEFFRNAQLNAWGMLLGSGNEPKFMLQVMNNSDTLRLIKVNKEFVVNLPSYDLKKKFMRTTRHYGDEVDEITTSGLTPEPCLVVSAPRVKECFAHNVLGY